MSRNPRTDLRRKRRRQRRQAEWDASRFDWVGFVDKVNEMVEAVHRSLPQLVEFLVCASEQWPRSFALNLRRNMGPRAPWMDEWVTGVWWRV